MLSRAELNALNKQFLEVQEHYRQYRDIESWHKMWEMIYNATESAVKKQLVGIYRDDIHDLTLDATCYISARYKKNPEYRITSLPSSCYFAALHIVRDPKLQFNDKLLSLEEINND